MYEDNDMIQRLAALAPTTPASGTQVRIAFEAGRRSAAAQLRRSRAVTGAAVVASLAVVVSSWLPRPRETGTGPVASSDAPAATVSVAAAAPKGGGGNLLLLRDAVLDRGLDALPRSPGSRAVTGPVLTPMGGEL